MLVASSLGAMTSCSDFLDVKPVGAVSEEELLNQEGVNYAITGMYSSMLTQEYFAAPFTKESLLYRDIFEKYYPGQARMVKDFWMPNKDWEGCDVKDPSARVLSNYGASGV